MRWPWLPASPGEAQQLIRESIKHALTEAAAVNDGRKAAAERTLPLAASERLRCLACGSAGPFASCVIVRDYAIRDGQLVSEPSGDRVACQRCGAQFTFSRDGAFQHHAHAEPFTGSARPTNAPQQQLEAPPTPDTPPHAHWPEARKRPPV